MIPPTKRFDIFSRLLGDAQKVYAHSDFSLSTHKYLCTYNITSYSSMNTTMSTSGDARYISVHRVLPLLMDFRNSMVP